jgi:hypothetical protein
MVQSTQAGPASIPPQAAGVTLSCRPDRAGNRLIFPYTLENHGPADVYVMDAVVVPDRTSGRPMLDRNAPVIWLGGDGFARVLQGIAALPPDRDVDVRVIPLAARLPPGDALERRLEVPLPLAETSPYYPDLPLREYELTDIQGIVLAVEFLRGTVAGFAADSVPDAPDLYRVRGQHTVGQVERVSCAFPSRQLQILKRPDNFPRPD